MEEEETKPTLESRVIVGLVVIFIVIVVVLVTKTIYDIENITISLVHLAPFLHFN
jgi:hypothetical protein